MFFIKIKKDFPKNVEYKGNTPDGVKVLPGKDTESNFVTWPGAEVEIKNAMIERYAGTSKSWIKIEKDKRARAITEARMNKYLGELMMSAPATDAPEVDIEITTTKLKDVNFDPGQFKVIKTGTFFDEFCSRKNGIPAARAIMVIGDPGIGKSSNLMDILVGAKDQGNKVLYVSAEMSPLDIHEFVQFYPGLTDVDFFYMGEHLLDPEITVPATMALKSVLNQGWDLVVFDSLHEIMGIVADEMKLSGTKAEKYVLEMISAQKKGFNEENIYTSFLLIQQMNKSGEFVGSNRLKHMTDAFLKLFWSKEEPGKRVMEFVKNRIGEVKLPLYYRFGDGDGIKYDTKRYNDYRALRNRMSKSEEDGIEETNLDSLLSVLQNTEKKEPQEIHYSNVG